MIVSNTTGKIYIAVSNDAQQHPIQPPVYCTLKRYSRYKVSPNQPPIMREFDVVIDVQGLYNGIVLTLTALPEADARYGLSITATDADGFSFASNRPIMLTQRGQVNENLPLVRKTLHLVPDFNMQAPAAQVHNNGLYFFPNVGAD